MDGVHRSVTRSLSRATRLQNNAPDYCLVAIGLARKRIDLTLSWSFKLLVSMTKLPTRERLIHAAMELFFEKGYGASGMAEILEKADANSGSFYHFFHMQSSNY